MLDATFVQALAKEFRARTPHLETIDGLEYLLVPGADDAWRIEDLPHPEIIPCPVKLGTLAGLVDYVKCNRDGLVLDKHLVQVASPTLVTLLGPLTGQPFYQRRTAAVADLSFLIGQDGFAFGQFIDCEAFVIALQSRFVQTPVRDELLKLVGNIKDESVRQVSDDGVTQAVTARTGAVLSREVDVPNPVTLAPYRTFREIGQPESRFVLRLRRGVEGQKPTCALFEADGSEWKLLAISRVADWLREHLVGTAVSVIA